MRSFEDDLVERLREIDASGLRRVLREISPSQSVLVRREDRDLVNFSSNDYLGLACHPALVEAAQNELACSGSGSGASRLISGSLPAHRRMEERLADFKRTPAALTFSSGYAAATGTIPALVSENDVVILDKLAHACLIDGAKLSGAHLRIFPHNDLNALESRLRWARDTHPNARILIVVESVYSMDGDTAPLTEIVELKNRHGAWLMVDEAHGVGVLGERGRGLVDATCLGDRVEVQMGTLGKALGSSGAYICGSATLRDLLINRARSFIFSTAPTPASVAAAEAAIHLLADTPEGAERLAKLHRNIQTLHSSGNTAIHPILVGLEADALAAASRLEAAGYLVPAVRFPSVARGQARLRISLTADHTPQMVDDLISSLRRGDLRNRA
ncbi:MAG: 8-amino-7-oxononanoate synthase [Terrimicrobiaceae bacterium]